MSAPENPPKLWCFALWHSMAGRIVLNAETEAGAVHLRKQEPEPHRCSPVQCYVREDVAEQAHDIAMAVAAGREDALRRERDALLARVEKLTGALGTIKSKGLAQEGWIGYSAFFVAESALKADAVAAGKGVG